LIDIADRALRASTSTSAGSTSLAAFRIGRGLTLDRRDNGNGLDNAAFEYELHVAGPA